ncbi:MAG: phosphoribosyltransferase regulatory subunit [Myxococcaceae bacterium]|nr:phosphoribosyltransferase regulatory subunit [Myxococcaceae bacterium]
MESAVHPAALTPLSGMRDLLPPESHARRKVSEQLQRVFESYGYDLITTPLFERVEVFERGLTLDPRDLLRFVEPDGGEVAALRPDITPQIARVVSTRLSDFPPPFRLRYEGTVIRRRRGRARRQRQIAQVGVELVGIRGAEADVEVIRLISEACTAAGLSAFRLELSDVGVGRTLLREQSPGLLALAAESLARKDEAQLERVLSDAGVPSAAKQRITALAHLHGGLEVLDEAEAIVRGTAAEPHVASLREVAAQLVELGLGPQLGVDLGEIRGAAYYTGVSFGVFAHGPGESIASGGRYDQLLSQYGAAQPATGAGIDIENLLAALDHAGLHWRQRDEVRFVVAGESGVGRPVVDLLAQRLRSAGHAAATLSESDAARARAYARAWAYDLALLASAQQITAVRSRDGATRVLAAEQGELASQDIHALLSWARDT